MARLYQKINGEAVPLGGGGGGSVAIDNVTITENSDDEIQVATTLTGKINQLNNVAADMGKVLTANGDGTAEWDDVLVPIDYETITKNSNGELQVSSVPYDNTESGLTADNMQDAIDELLITSDNVQLDQVTYVITRRVPFVVSMFENMPKGKYFLYGTARKDGDFPSNGGLWACASNGNSTDITASCPFDTTNRGMSTFLKVVDIENDGTLSINLYWDGTTGTTFTSAQMVLSLGYLKMK